MNRRRLTVEQWRDAVLFVSGELSDRGGKSLELDDPANHRRTVYGRVSRLKLNDTAHAVRLSRRERPRREAAPSPPPRCRSFSCSTAPSCLDSARALAPTRPTARALRRRRIRRAYRLLFGRDPQPDAKSSARARFPRASPKTANSRAGSNTPRCSWLRTNCSMSTEPFTRCPDAARPHTPADAAAHVRRLRPARPRSLLAREPPATLAAQSLHPRAARQARHLPVHERRPVARRYVRPEARARQSTKASSPTGELYKKSKGTGFMPSPLEVQQARPERHRGERDRCRNSRSVHRRLLRHPLDAHRRAESRAGSAPDAHRQRPADPPVAGLVAPLRPGHREPEPARLRRPPPQPKIVVGPALWSNSFLPGAIPGHQRDHLRHAGR